MPLSSSYPLIAQSWRAVSRHRRFATLAMVSLALAIALNVTMYSVLDALIHPRLDMRDHRSLYQISFYGDLRRRLTAEERNEAVDRLPIIEGLAGRMMTWGGPLAERGTVFREIRLATVSPNYFAVVGVQPLAGRLLSARDVEQVPAPVVVSDIMWKQFFPDRAWFDSATVHIEGEPHPVIGVLAYTADFPGEFTDVFRLPPAAQARAMPRTVLRVKDGVTMKEAAALLQEVAVQLGARAGEGPRDVAYRITPAIGAQFQYQRFHLALIGAVVAVLLVACVNLANLQLARGVTRARELATRAAVGASRAQIIRQLLAESAWLALGGLALGLMLTLWGVHVLSATIPLSLAEYVMRPQVTWRLFAFAALVTVAALTIIGLVPAWRLSRVDINDVLKAGAGTGSTRRGRRQYGALVVVQVGLALALLSAATLLGRTAVSILRVQVNPAWEKLFFGFAMVRPQTRADSMELLSNISRTIVNTARATPTVAEAATLRNARPQGRFISLSDPGGAPVQIQAGLWSYSFASPSIIRALGGVITKGRDFTDEEFAEPLAIVDEGTALFLWPGQDPIGRQIKLGAANTSAPWVRVVGVARVPPSWFGLRTTHEVERLRPHLGSVYVLQSLDTTRVFRYGGFQVVVRGTTAPHRLPVLLRRSFAPRMPRLTTRIFSYEDQVGLTRQKERHGFVAGLFAVFALLALATAAMGVYAVVSHSVRTRTREFGVRVALGATVQHIRQAVFFEGNVLSLLGIAVGLILTARTAKFLIAFLMGEEEIYDAWLFGLVALFLFGITLMASWLPARRAMRIDAAEALRND